MREAGYHVPQTHAMWGGEEMWEWTRIPLAALHRTDRRRNPPGWLLGPNFGLRPRQRHLGTLWFLANLVLYLVHKRRTILLEDTIDFLWRARRKNYQEKKNWETEGNYLEIL